MQENFENHFHCAQDVHSASWVMFMAISRWFGQRLDALCIVFICCVAYMSILFQGQGLASPGSVGLSITYALGLVGMFQWCVRQSTEVESIFTSVERLQEYIDLEPEVKVSFVPQKPAKEWPQSGAISFKSVSFAHYKGGPDILKELTFDVKAREKIGVIGRTGAGKFAHCRPLPVKRIFRGRNLHRRRANYESGHQSFEKRSFHNSPNIWPEKIRVCSTVQF